MQSSTSRIVGCGTQLPWLNRILCNDDNAMRKMPITRITISRRVFDGCRQILYQNDRLLTTHTMPLTDLFYHTLVSGRGRKRKFATQTNTPAVGTCNSRCRASLCTKLGRRVVLGYIKTRKEFACPNELSFFSYT